ncbi:hypothetical protein JKF63_03132 [Porcisia hertigi]|uniref:Uncharacterized protein n=1 Tax=Porcisia hertigi TaxID=2761500 RepID=A0A836IEC8_9TRYP|nr:hypothetical protein JKF63_03132 [Porcisia hertigi]
MRLHLEDAYKRLCAEYNTSPLSSFLGSLRNTFALPDGDVFIDGSSLEGDHFCVFAELLRQLLLQPIVFAQPLAIRTGSPAPLLEPSASHPPKEHGNHKYYDVVPRLLRIKLRFSRNANNADVERVCNLIATQKVLNCIPSPLLPDSSTNEKGPVTGTLSQSNWPERAVIESIDLNNCVFVSLPGGRALRAAVRRNVYVQNVFLEGCSVNAAVVAQIAQVTRSNRLQFHLACAAFD